MMDSVVECSTFWQRRVRWPRVISPTPLRSLGSRRVGPTTAMSPSCSSSLPTAVKWPYSGAAGASACGTWRSGCTRPARRWYLPTRRAGIREEKWLRSLGVARPQHVGDAGIPVEIEGTSGPWRVDPEATADGFEGRTALLSPFDRLIHDRVRAVELFDFEYNLEMYKPAAKRRWGFFALPVLHDDRLVGKVDATVDRKGSLLQVNAVHKDVPFTRAMTAAVKAELRALATWLALDDVRYT